MFSHVRRHTATIRELRTDFRSVKRRIEQHGEVVITDHDEPACLIKARSQALMLTKSACPPDYYERLHKRPPDSLSAEATRQFWEEERR